MLAPTSKFATFLAELKGRLVFHVVVISGGDATVVIPLIDGAAEVNKPTLKLANGVPVEKLAL